MPYFKELNVLFIHVPKTGGSSLEIYFLKKNRNIKENIECIDILITDENTDMGHSYQHCTYRELLINADKFKIDFNDKLKKISIVRNPYERLISDLYWNKIINNMSTPMDIENGIKEYFKNEYFYDNHKLPQYDMIKNITNKIDDDIIILRTESLTDDMHKIGFDDFHEYENKTPNKQTHINFLTEESKNMIYEYYKIDFDSFGYTK
jgi:hypothetical protein